MLTKTEPNVDLSQKMIAETLEKSSILKAGQSLKVYIPNLMTYIKKGTPGTSLDKTCGNSIFINDNACKPKLPLIVQTQNYLTASVESNSSFDLIKTVENKLEYLKPGISIQCTCKNKKLNKITFNTNYNV